MWGLVFRIQGARVQTSVPGFLTSAHGTYYTIDYIQRCVAELARHPERYGFDPNSVYDLLVQTWDCALSPVRSLAWGRERAGHGPVGLIPDFYYTADNGYAGLRAAATDCPAWSERDAGVAWRGSVTGRGPYSGPDAIPRVRLVETCRGLDGVDVRLTGVHETMSGVMPLEVIGDYVRAHGLLGDYWAMPRFGGYRHTIDIDGHANAWGLFEKLLLGCCVLKVESPYEQWFYDRLRPWVNYVPVRADLADVAERIDWCLSHEADCEWIAGNGRRLATSLTLEAVVEHSCIQIIKAAHPRRAGDPG